jgi:hypothetical protein
MSSTKAAAIKINAVSPELTMNLSPNSLIQDQRSKPAHGFEIIWDD